MMTAAKRGGMFTAADVDCASCCSGVATTRAPALGRSNFVVMGLCSSMFMMTTQRLPSAARKTL